MKAVAFPLALRFALPVALLIALLSAPVVLLVACDQGKKDRPAPPPPTPSGVLKGHITATMNGPGRAHAPEESFSRTTPIECKVLVLDRAGNTFETTANADGRYEMTLPAGHYDVSFNDCRGDRSCYVPAPMPVEVPADGATAADWDCEMDAK